MRRYEFEIVRYKREGASSGVDVTSYEENDGHFTTNKPRTNQESREVIESMKSLARLLRSDKLKVRLEID